MKIISSFLLVLLSGLSVLGATSVNFDCQGLTKEENILTVRGVMHPDRQTLGVPVWTSVNGSVVFLDYSPNGLFDLFLNILEVNGADNQGNSVLLRYFGDGASAVRNRIEVRVNDVNSRKAPLAATGASVICQFYED